MVKVKKINKREFIPIVMTIETEAEASMLWHRLNVSENESFADYCKETKKLNAHAMDTLPMWRALDDVFRPEK